MLDVAVLSALNQLGCPQPQPVAPAPATAEVSLLPVGPGNNADPGPLTSLPLTGVVSTLAKIPIAGTLLTALASLAGGSTALGANTVAAGLAGGAAGVAEGLSSLEGGGASQAGSAAANVQGALANLNNLPAASGASLGSWSALISELNSMLGAAGLAASDMAAGGTSGMPESASSNINSLLSNAAPSAITNMPTNLPNGLAAVQQVATLLPAVMPTSSSGRR